MAAEYIEADSSPPGEAGLRKSSLAGAWRLASSDGQIVLLFSDSSVAAVVKSLTPKSPPLVGATVVAHYGDDPGVLSKPFLTAQASGHMPGWRLSLYLNKPDPFAAAARRQNAAYLWIGSLGILAIVILAIAVARYIGRQMKLTRLKNDLIATVSHELKTPLAGMRVLVDTLLEGRCESHEQANEYFRLIARENTRLSRLIDNFLTFSRMERNKKAFEFDEVAVGEIVTEAVDSVREKFASPGCNLDVDVAAGLPAVNADRDALITVILNLLDNAWKYSGHEKRIGLRAYADDGAVCLEVSDNGIGMSRRAVRKVFDRFYQVDQTLSRRVGGCGLGLSIVKFIIDAHGGSIDVSSRQDEGSTFTVRLPVTIQIPAANSQRKQPSG
jgi:signal transduction histidine kinase